MKWAEGRKRAHDWFLDYGEIAFVLSILTVAAIIIAWMLVLLLTPKTVTAGDITNFRSARRLAAALPFDKVTTRYSEPVKILFMEISAYSPTAAECDAAPLITASGQRVRVGGIAADLRVLPLGSLVIIPNYNGGKPCTVIDSGGAIRGNKLDVFMWSTDAAIHWGRRKNVEVRVLYVPKAAT